MGETLLNARSLCLLALGVALSWNSVAQMTVTGTVTGSVTDPSGQVIVGSRVTLTSPKTGESRSTTTNNTGAFSFIAVPPDTYAIKAESQGFKGYEQTGLVVSANERVAVGDLQLQVGSVSETG